MNEVKTFYGPMKIYAPEETEELFVPLRDRIFDMTYSPLWNSGCVFRDASWMRIIIRGAVMYSDRASPPWERHETVEDWEFADPRDELQPLFDLLVEDGILDVVHMLPYGDMEEIRPDGVKKLKKADALVTRPTGPAVRSRAIEGTWWSLPERLLFDRTGRWGMYGSDEEFGLLGGEPAFMEEFVDRSGGMEFIREKADRYWQYMLDHEYRYEGRLVPHYYKLAGWDNPPRRREEKP